MQLSITDLYSIENRNHEEKSNNLMDQIEDTLQKDGEIEIEGYNPNWTLRKCCSKLLDNLSNLYPNNVYDVIKTLLESDIQNNDWLIKYEY